MVRLVVGCSAAARKLLLLPLLQDRFQLTTEHQLQPLVPTPHMMPVCSDKECGVRSAGNQTTTWHADHINTPARTHTIESITSGHMPQQQQTTHVLVSSVCRRSHGTVVIAGFGNAKGSAGVVVDRRRYDSRAFVVQYPEWAAEAVAALTRRDEGDSTYRTALVPSPSNPRSCQTHRVSDTARRWFGGAPHHMHVRGTGQREGHVHVQPTQQPCMMPT